MVGAFGDPDAAPSAAGPRRARSWSASASSTSAWPPARSRCGRRPRPGCDGRLVHVVLDAERPRPRGRRCVGTYGLEAGRRPGHRPRRGRRVRRQDRRPPRGPAAGAGWPAAAAGRCAGSRPAPRTCWPWCTGRAQVQDVAIGGRARRHDRGLPPGHLARTPAPTRASAALLPVPDPHHGGRHLRHPRGRPPTPGSVVTTTVAHRRLPGRGPARGHGRHRAGRRPVRGRGRRSTRPRCGAATCCPASTSPTPRRAGATYDCGDYPAALSGRWPPRATTSCGPSSAGAGRRATPWRWASACRPTSRSPRARRPAPSSPGSRWPPAATTATASRSSSYTGSSPHGQGLATAFAMLVADELGVRMERVRVVHGDTDLVARGVGTFGSRSLQLGGSAVRARGAGGGREARRLAADLLEAPADDVVLDTAAGRFHVAGTPAVSRALGRGAPAPRASRRPGARAPSTTSPPSSPRTRSAPTWPWSRSTPRPATSGSCAWWPCDDAGRVLNPLLAEGQRHGGMAQGAAQALFEEVAFDADGNPLTTNFADYAFLSAAELPSFELVDLETPDLGQPAGRQGHRRVRHDRLDAGGAERGVRRRRPPGRAPHRHALHARAGVAGHPGGDRELTPAAAISRSAPLGPGDSVSLSQRSPGRGSDAHQGGATCRSPCPSTARSGRARSSLAGCWSTTCGTTSGSPAPTSAATRRRAGPARSCWTASRSSRARCWPCRPTAHAVTTIEGLAATAGADDGGATAAPHAAGVPRRARPAVRLLHARHGHGRGVAARGEPPPTEHDVRVGLEGNLCRCTGYHNIVRAVLAAAGEEVPA